MLSTREIFIAIVDNDCIKKSDAIILLEGDGTYRCSKAVELFQARFAPFIVFSGGMTDYSYGSYPFIDILPVLLSENVPSEAIIHEPTSINTKEQAREIVKMASNNNWKKIILIASHYHQYRAYLTFINEIITSSSELIIYNAPASNLSWFNDNPWGSRISLLNEEFIKIEKYTALGHLASMDQAIEYQKWKEIQP
jgi:uncharacterized SAM-binding protein YcdF (DUF218 family)